MHRTVLRCACGGWRPGPGSDFHCRTATLGIDAPRTDPGVPFQGRGHAGTHPAHRPRDAGNPIGSRRSPLPGCVLRISYEDVVEDLEGNVRGILDFCGLEFEPACVEFYRTKRSVYTASSEQVRQPIFHDGLFQWRNYEAWLGPLKDSLGDA